MKYAKGKKQDPKLGKKAKKETPPPKSDSKELKQLLLMVADKLGENTAPAGPNEIKVTAAPVTVKPEIRVENPPPSPTTWVFDVTRDVNDKITRVVATPLGAEDV